MSRTTWPIVAVLAAFCAYAIVVTTLWLTGQPTPPAAVGSVIVALFVSATVVAATRAILAALGRCAGRQELDALAERVRELEERLDSPLYVAPVPRQLGTGLDPESIGAVHRLHDKLRPMDGEG